MRNKKLAGISMLLLLIFTMLPVPIVRALQGVNRDVMPDPGPNLLANSGFEGTGKSPDNSAPNYDNWTRETFNGVSYGEIFTPEGWVTWWQEGEFKRPECKVIPNDPPYNGTPHRIHHGYYSAMCFTFFGKQNAGHYQVVRNIAPGTVVEGSMYAHAWSSGEDGEAVSSGDPYSFYFRVGIDPTGGTDPFSGNIVWSNAHYLYDNYGLVGPVQATVGEAGVATFFSQAYGKWKNKHNDAYWDSASLVAVSAGEPPTATPQPPPPTSNVPATPFYTPTPLPDGSTVHVVQEGDTMFGLSLQYGVGLDKLRQMNAGTVINDLLSIGQEVVISPGPLGIATPTPEPQATPEPESTAETPAATVDPNQPANPVATAENPGGLPSAPADGMASVCVTAFSDNNGDAFRQADQELPIAGAQINLVGTSGPLTPYMTDGISEPYCFSNLPPGNYILRHTPPAGYQLASSDTGQLNMILSAGQTMPIDVGYVRSDGSAQVLPNTNNNPDETVKETPEATAEPDKANPGGLAKVLNTILQISGVAVAVVTLGMVIVFFRFRRPI